MLVEEFLPGREFTVGILGTGRDAYCLGTLEIVLLDEAEPDVYSYVNKERCEELVEYRLVDAERGRAGAASRRDRPGGLADAGLPRRRTNRFALRCGGIARSFWKPIRWPVCIRRTRICRCWQPRSA